MEKNILKDDEGKDIFIGDKLRSKWGYEVIVAEDEFGDLYGKLVCDDNHSCKNIPYSLNNGKDHIKVLI